MLWLFHYFQEKKMKTIILTVMAAIAISGCALFKENKTPLSPHGQLNACLRDEINQMTEDGRVVSLGNTAAAQKAARYCLAKFEMTDAFSQNMAFRNAQSLLTKSEGTSLR